MEVAVTRVARSGVSELAPQHFDDIAPCEALAWDRAGTLNLTFTGDLTPDQVQAIRLRCIAADAGEEAILASAAQAYRTNQDFLGIPAPTAVQSIGQVAALTRQMQGVLRFLTRL